MDFKIGLQSSLVTMVGGMPTGSRGVVMSPNAHDGSSHVLCTPRTLGLRRLYSGYNETSIFAEVPAIEDRLPGGWTNRSQQKHGSRIDETNTTRTDA